TIATPPGTTSQRTFHVDAAAGDDARSVIDAQDASRPWRTIARALSSDAASAGDTVLVADGTYAEAVQTTKPGVTLRALGAAVIAAPPGGLGIEIQHAQITVEGFTVRGGLHGIRVDGATGVVVRGCTLGGQSGNGIFVVQSDGATIDGNRVDGAGA